MKNPPQLTYEPVAARVRIALSCYHRGLDEAFEDTAAALFADVVQSIALGRCPEPARCCQALLPLLCLQIVGDRMH